MNDVAAQIAMRASNSEAPVLPALNPVPLTPESILASARQAEAAKHDAWDIAQKISDLASNPERMQETLDNVASEFDEHAPQTAMDARLATARMISFLASKAPKASVFAPGMPEMKPTQADLNKFDRYIRAVVDPTSILDDAYDGTLTPEGLDAVRTVYPNLYSQMQVDLADRVNNAEKIPYKRKIQLSALLGQDMSGTLNPRLGMLAQSAYAATGAAPAPVSRSQQMPVSRAQGLNAFGRAGAETTAWREAQESGTRARLSGQGRR